MVAREIMSSSVITIGKDTSIEEVAETLTKNNISGVPVVNEANEVIGIITERDLLYKDIEPRFPPVVEILGGMIFLKGVKKYQEQLKKIVATKAEDIMSRDVVMVPEDMPVQKIAQLMVEKEINRVPVVKNGKLVGIVVRGDIVKYIARNLL